MVTKVVLVLDMVGKVGRAATQVQDNLKTLGTPSGPVLATLHTYSDPLAPKSLCGFTQSHRAG